MPTKTSLWVATLNAECFGEDDEYSSPSLLTSLLSSPDHGLIRVFHQPGQLAGYLLYRIHDDHIECLRRGVLKPYRRFGYGVKLTKRALKVCQKLGLRYETYCSIENLGSLNSSLKCGLRVTAIQPPWVLMHWTPRVATPGAP